MGSKSVLCALQDAKQESTILKLQELYDCLRAALKGSKRRSGLTLVDHSGTSQGHGAWYPPPLPDQSLSPEVEGV